MDGPQQGTYLVKTSQMITKHPRNIHDEDLENEDLNFERPLSEPTLMSYFIQRIRYGEISRQIADIMQYWASSEPTTHEHIMRIDKQFVAFFNELPLFFRLDEHSRLQSSQVEANWPQVTTHRYILGLIVPSRRCVLHLKYLINGLKSPNTLSRDACLESARAIVHAKRLLDRETNPFAPMVQKNFGAIQHLFIGSVVFAMDFCYNRTPGAEAQRRDELTDVCLMLRNDAERSTIAGKFLDVLLDTLRDHDVVLPALSSFTSRHKIGQSTPGPGEDISMDLGFDKIWAKYISTTDWFDDFQVQ